MSIIICDVDIKADKDINDINDTAYIIIQRKEYVFNPYIKEVQFDFKSIKRDTSQLIYGVDINFKKLLTDSTFGRPMYLTVIHKDQVTDIIRKKHFPIFIKNG